MAKNNKIWIIFAIIIVVAIMSMEGKKESLSASASLSRCEERRQDKIDAGYDCVGGCVKITSDLKSCMFASGGGFAGDIGDYIIFYNEDNTCEDIYDEGRNAMEQMDCLYGGIPDEDDVCDSNKWRCFEYKEQQCKSDGSDWKPAIACGADSICNDATGRCESTAPPPAVDVWCLEKNCMQYTCRKQENTCSISTYFSTKFSSSTACTNAAPTLCTSEIFNYRCVGNTISQVIDSQLIKVGTCNEGEACGDAGVLKSREVDSTTELTLSWLASVNGGMCTICTADNSCATNICPDKTCVNNCGKTIPGTKDCGTPPPEGKCEFYQTEKDGECKTAGWVIMVFAFFAVMIGIKMIGQMNK